MERNLVSIIAFLLIFVMCAWGTWHGCAELRSQVKSGKGVDQTLSEVDKTDAPKMYALQLLGFVILIGSSVAIGIGVIVALIQKVVAD